MNKHEPLFACVSCGDEQTFPADHLRTHGGELWCNDCWGCYSASAETGLDFIDLPQFIPEADLKIQALTEGMQAIKRHMEIMGAGNLGAAWNIADTALKKAEAIGKCTKPGNAAEPWNAGCGMAPDGGYECNCGQCE